MVVAAITNATLKLDQIYERLEHVKIDSYVNSRIVDSLGELPIPASEAGLLVDFVGGGTGTPFNVNVTNTLLPVGAAGEVPLPVSIDAVTGSIPITGTITVGTVTDPVTVRPEYLDFYYNQWRPALGYGVTRTTYTRTDGTWTGTHAGCVPLAQVTGVDGSATGSDIGAILAESALTDMGVSASLFTAVRT